MKMDLSTDTKCVSDHYYYLFPSCLPFTVKGVNSALLPEGVQEKKSNLLERNEKERVRDTILNWNSRFNNFMPFNFFTCCYFLVKWHCFARRHKNGSTRETSGVSSAVN